MPGSLHQRASGPTLPGPPSPLKMLFFYPNQASSGWIYSTVSSLSKYISLQVKLHFPQCPQLGRWSTLSTLLRLPCFTAPSSSPSLGVGGINIMTNTCHWLLCLCVSMSGRGWRGCKSFPQHQKGGTQSSPLGWYHTPVLGAFQFSSVAQSCPTLCDPMNRSTSGLPVHHQLPEFTETHVHRVSDAIQPSHPLSSASPPAPNPSQHQSLFQ